jgi:hypothetical protein
MWDYRWNGKKTTLVNRNPLRTLSSRPERSEASGVEGPAFPAAYSAAWSRFINSEVAFNKNPVRLLSDGVSSF